ncbi:MAG: efflux transporter periplasmic adaptor subunit [Deltaproteobacteria bacterium]|nr:MAG: efflux transporter periplasmic adaptor subunit [Deltaproteobacteria bacterium]
MSGRKKPSRWRGVVAAASVALLVLAFLGTLVFLYLKSQGDAPVFKTETPKVTDIVKKAVATGSIVPRREVQIKARVSGIVKELRVQPGDLVDKGMLIAEIKIVPNMAALTQAEAAVHKARIAVKHAEAEHHRAERLSGGGLLSERALSERKLDFNLRRAELSAAHSQLQVVKEGASRSRGETANTKIRSTVAGTVLEVPVEEGGSVIESNNFNEGTTIAVVADMGDMIFLGRIDEADVDKVRTGMAVNIRIGAIDERQFEGKLETIAPKGQQIEGAIQFEIKAALNREKGVVIRAGYSANAEIVLEEKPQVLAVSESLLQFEGDQPYVEVETAPGVYERQDLTVGISDGINIEVKDGVTAESKIRQPQPKPQG